MLLSGLHTGKQLKRVNLLSGGYRFTPSDRHWTILHVRRYLVTHLSSLLQRLLLDLDYCRYIYKTVKWSSEVQMVGVGKRFERTGDFNCFFCYQCEVLMVKWKHPEVSADIGGLITICSTFNIYCNSSLGIAHESPLAGHLDINKTSPLAGHLAINKTFSEILCHFIGHVLNVMLL